MTQQHKRILLSMLVLIILVLAGILSARSVWAQDDVGPDRTATLVVDVTEYQWWLLRWEDNQAVCDLWVDHEGLPELWEMYADCDEDVVDEWIETPPCPAAAEGGETSTCKGYYLFLNDSREAVKEVVQTLPEAQVWVSLENCQPAALSHRCEGEPHLTLIGEEPLANYDIFAIHYELEGESYSCFSDTCQVALAASVQGETLLTYWAESTYGDESREYELRLRASLLEPGDDFMDGIWQVDVITDHWRGEPLPACSVTWESFPPVGEPPGWLVTPEEATALSSNVPYELLATQLLQWGLVDASSCPDGGLNPDGTASQCGLDQSRDDVEVWQNRFDQRIIKTARETGVPAWLIKGLFAQESQFWPGGFPDLEEYGLGGLHVNGSDALLLWNVSFYQEFCPLVLSKEACETPYHQLSEANQELLRGALAIQANVSCTSCPYQFDQNRADQSVDLFADILLANCEQTAQTVLSNANQTPGDIASYPDLWRLTLVNYNAGPGCLARAVNSVYLSSRPLTWDAVAEELENLAACRQAVSYVERITSLSGLR